MYPLTLARVVHNALEYAVWNLRKASFFKF